MKMITTMQCIENFFNGSNEFVGIQLTIPNAPGCEIIINPKENFKEKLAYYKKTYDEDGVHKHVPSIKIIGWSCGNTFQELQDGLEFKI
jgi:hypothetical protein